ncbi:hypothetical protein H2199_004459 [Coniosporium tulheliwenetii]|uniref:Uncharacterized protein n=1 Tax=Coniosporium tulheliwenetii TaxID=3383036 RepID=A0ACC2Z6K8_9PEZI|nr:hypothetical protein H2199_004459 [Cladosporium sp. JES 115]
MSSYSPYPNDAYAVGWISALPIKFAAAKGMLDEEHGDPKTPKQKADRNTYASAAAVAREMLSTFPNIKIGVLVGIGAGIPDYDGDEEQDIRLGDVVISSDSETGGVVAYDSGKRLHDGTFKVAYPLDQPPVSLRTALSALYADHEMRGNRIPQYLQAMLAKHQHMEHRYKYPGQLKDVLFRADYQHQGGKSCAKCDPRKAAKREPDIRADANPVIHHGVIATGSSVVKYAPFRDEIRRKHRAICFEMEAAGLMNNFPCLVIRGISDYADSHKNDDWH